MFRVKTMKMKKFLSLLLTFAMLAGTFSVTGTVFAEDEITPITDDGIIAFTEIEGYDADADSAEEYIENFNYLEETYADAIAAMKKAAESFKPNVTLTKYNVPLDVILDLLDIVWYNEYCYQINGYSARVDSTGEYVISFTFAYGLDQETYEESKPVIDEALQAVADEASHFDTEVEQVLYVHDWILENIEYDYESDDICINSPYGAIINGTTKCQGYAMVFRYIMQLLGIDCYYTTSDKLNHIWDLVVIDGELYYVDCTFDDTTYDVNYDDVYLSESPISGAYVYDSFLDSDSTMRKSGHRYTDWMTNGVSAYGCASSTYDSYFWKDTFNNIAYCDGYWYYTVTTDEGDGFYLYQVEFLSNTEYTETLVRTVETAWDGETEGYDIDYFYSNTQVIGTRLYYKTNEGIYYYNPDGASVDDDVLVYENTTEYNLYDFVINDDYTFTVLYGADDEIYNESDTAEAVTLSNVDYICANHSHQYEGTTVEATCVDDAYYTYTCLACGETYTGTEEGTATGEHTYEWEIASSGYVEKTCSVCSDVKVTLAFTDISSETEYFDYIAYTSYYNSLITGVKANSTDITTETFSPRTSLTRAMLVTILYRMAGSPYDDENPYTETPFSDVVAGVWYYNAVCWALDNGITTETKFKPNTNVTREQTATFLYRYAGEYLGEDVSTDNDISSYPDASSVSAYAEEAMSWANDKGMITGTQQGYLNPQGTTLRVHATKILYNFGLAYSVGNFE